MKKNLLESEDGHLLDYEDVVALLIFKMQELKQVGWSDKRILEYFADDNFEGDLKRITRLK